jgi:hypothetical protein
VGVMYLIDGNEGTITGDELLASVLTGSSIEKPQKGK